MDSSGPKWKASRFIRVTTSVTAVNMKTGGTVARAFAQTDSRELASSASPAATYAEPRKAAVRGTLIVQADVSAVRSGMSSRGTLMANTSRLATNRSRAIAGVVV